MMKSLGAKTIIFPAPVFIVGSYDTSGKPNLMAVAWGGVCCSEPPCVSIAVRQARYTYGNIMEHRAFTVNIPSEKYMKKADYIGIASGRAGDKFSATGLTPVKSRVVDAPYVKEFPFILECALLRVVRIGSHTVFIGEIKDVKAQEAMLGKEGAPDIKKIKPLIFDPAGLAYYGVGRSLGKAFSIGKEKK
jgi:flavin reductase (DIM6/NTAB) family NADH-FMN oxidoreductase RutF